jgi:hypothetical protein
VDRGVLSANRIMDMIKAVQFRGRIGELVIGIVGGFDSEGAWR